MAHPQPQPAPGLPTWVRQRDGRLLPFDPDRICLGLFAAGERLGRPDAFLARELTDGVLHFLAAEAPGSCADADWLDDLVAKVVRELRHPELARVLQSQPAPPSPTQPPSVPFHFSPLETPHGVAQACLTEYSLHAVFSREVAAVHRDGLLTLLGLEAPLDLAAQALGPARAAPEAPAGPLPTAVLAIEGPEHTPALLDAAFRWPRGIVNLHVSSSPAWAGLPEGPLFADPQSRPSPVPPDSLLDRCLAARERVRVVWHIHPDDFSRPGRLQRVVRAALDGATVAFAFPRPRRPVPLGAGVDRANPAALLAVGLHLPRLADLSGVGRDHGRFLGKLGSLARLALSAAVQKRAFLRRLGGDLGRGFLLDRARLVAVPVGLEAVARRFLDGGLGESRPALDFARAVVQRLREVLAADGGRVLVDACLETPWDFALAGGLPRCLEDVVGLTPWDALAAPKQQLRAAGVLHAAAGAGTAALRMGPDHTVSPEELTGLLQYAWRQTEVICLRLVRSGASEQLSFPGL